MIHRVTVLSALLLLLVYGLPPAPLDAPLRKLKVPAGWWRGNTHTHSLWSDGGGAPEWIVHWYRQSEYDFLVLSDHNIMLEGERWLKVGSRPTPAQVEELVKLFGASQVDLRTVDGQQQMRLQTLAELRNRFEDKKFLLMCGEELTDHLGDIPVHVNGLNLAEMIPPQGGNTVREMMNRNVDAVVEQGKRLQRPVLAHVNHPNFRFAVTWEDIAHVRNDRFFEVYNGHHLAGNVGDATHPSTEVMWDRANTLRLTELKLPVLFGMATDDSHDYHKWGLNRRNPGRGWVVVRAPALETEALLGALHRGDFYSSSGVVLQDFGVNDGRYWLRIQPEAGLSYRVRFVGRAGTLLAEESGLEASYRFKGDELFVRAVVESSRAHPNPDVAGEFEKAWLQPVTVGSSTNSVPRSSSGAQ